MHTTEGKKFRFFHHGDFSGDIYIADKNTGKTILSVPFDDLKALVAEWVQDEKISNLEDANDDTILLGPLSPSRRRGDKQGDMTMKTPWQIWAILALQMTMMFFGLVRAPSRTYHIENVNFRLGPAATNEERVLTLEEAAAVEDDAEYSDAVVR